MKISFYLKKPKEKRSPIYISVYWKSPIRIRVPLNLEIDVKFWDNNSNFPKKNTPNYFDYKKELDRIESEINDLSVSYAASHTAPNKELLKRDVKNIINPTKKEVLTFIQHLELFIKNRYESDYYRNGTAKSFIPLLNLLTNFEKSKKTKITFRSIDRKFMNEFHGFMIKQDNIFNSYAKKQLSNLKTFLNDCYKQGYLNNLDFREFTPSNNEYSTKVDIRLNKFELKLIEDYVPENETLQRAKDLFLIQCYTGLRVSDLMKLSFENFDLRNGELKVVTTKTTKPARIPIHNKLNSILKKYNYLDLPKLSDQYYNRRIKALCKDAGLDQSILIEKYKGTTVITERYEKWELMTSNVARKTFITGALELGLKDFEVMKITGHKKRETLSKYIKLTEDEAVEKARILFNQLLEN